ncbi:MAG: Na(+)-translocating NADH-quinone reductase subunit C [Pseudomonadales bacterium]|nr:Na(+)-translocating NADH-quinone reductase subunit C [Pseudomonadales bacterium]MCP5357449.1 Na(+)-translocating NADH-quinone reductase subunit C [Pseudomonadales bacterium]
MASKDSVSFTVKIALLLCVVCSIFISSAAVILKPFQEANKTLDRNKNILAAAGMFNPDVNSDSEVDGLFAQFTPRIVDLNSGEFLSDAQMADLGINPVSYDQRAAINDPQLSDAIPGEEDIASLKRRVRYATVYLVEGSNGEIEDIVLPVSGYGLWGTMYGYLALEGDGNTVKGIGFYEQKETPGLGGEVTNPRWKGLWPGKEVYDDNGNVALSVIKGVGQGVHQVDGLAGASLTSRGVDNLIEYWMGPKGFGPFLKNLTNS